MIMQRIAGLFCAVSIASLMARYMSWVIAFFFSGRRSLTMRLASSSVTIRWPFMMPSFGTGGEPGRRQDRAPHATSCGAPRKAGGSGRADETGPAMLGGVTGVMVGGGGEGTRAALPIPEGSLTEPLSPRALAGPGGMPLTPASCAAAGAASAPTTASTASQDRET